MSSAHFVYIPLVAFGGLIIGFVLGARAAQNAIAQQKEKDAQRAEARARREARKAAK